METTYKQTIINGFKVTIFFHYNGTQLFINDKDGVQIFAHKVSGDALAKAKAIIASIAPEPMEAPEPVQADKMICISDRRAEFVEATLRGKDNRLDVFNGWDKDTFFVFNRDNDAEYEVRLGTRDGKLFGSCSCPDFSFRNRTCKHLAAVMVDALFAIAAKN